MLTFKGENKRLSNLHEQKFADLAAFQVNTTVFQASSVVIQRSLQEKIKDPGKFIIPCTIGNSEMGKALCDSRASINLMPLSVVKRLSLGELTSITMTL